MSGQPRRRTETYKGCHLQQHEIAYEGGFVHYTATFPDLAIVAGCQDIIEELNSIIKLKDPEFLFNYDTTFSLGDFTCHRLYSNIYCSTKKSSGCCLIFNPERKLHETPDIFLKQLDSLVKPRKGLPIVTDMEAAIVKSVRQKTSLTQMGCWRHFR